MSELSFKFTPHKDVTSVFESFLDYMFSASPKEAARQSRTDVVVGYIDAGETEMVRTDDFFERRDMLLRYRKVLAEVGARPEHLGCFDVVVGYDETDGDGLDLCVQAIVLSLVKWSFSTNSTVAFSIHLAQVYGDTLEPVHFHVLWDRREGSGMYRDDLLQYFIDTQLS